MENHKAYYMQNKLGVLTLLGMLILSCQQTTCMRQNSRSELFTSRLPIISKTSANETQAFEDKNTANNNPETIKENNQSNSLKNQRFIEHQNYKVSSLPFLTVKPKDILEKEPQSPKTKKPKSYKIPKLLITNLAGLAINNSNKEFSECPSSPNSPVTPPEELKESDKQEGLINETELYEKVKTEFQKNNNLTKLEPEKDFYDSPKSNENSFSEKQITRKKSFRELLKKITIEYKTHKTKDNNNKTKKILGVSGTIFFCDIRNFTFFSNKCQNAETPAIFMSEFSSAAEEIFKCWNANLTSTAGDSFVVIFPKKKTELNTNESFKNAILCSIEFVCKMSEFIKTKKQEHFPKRFDLGLESGWTFFFKPGKSNNIVPIAVVSKTINNAQRFEAHSKQSKSRKITISEKAYNMLDTYKPIKQLFTQKTLLHAKGIEGRPFVYSCSEKSIEDFYKSPDWEIYKKEIIERNLECRPTENLNSLLETL